MTDIAEVDMQKDPESSERAAFASAEPLSREEIAAAIRCCVRECDHDIVHPVPTRRALLKTIEHLTTDHSDGSPLARLKAVAELAESKLGHSPYSSRPPEQAISDALDDLLRLCGPACPYDGKLAVEHTYLLCKFGDENHAAWCAGAEWLAKRNA